MFRAFNLHQLPLLVIPAVVFLIVIGSGDATFAQVFDGGGTPPVVTDGGAPVGGDGAGAAVDGAGAGTGGTGGTDSDGMIEAVEPVRLEFDIPDRRNQGFVGSTAAGIDSRGFVGPQTTDPDTADGIAEGRFIGGNVNVDLGNRPATQATPLQENGFTVQRRGMRSRMRPAFAAPQMSGAVTTSRFVSRMTRQPVVRQFGQGVSMTISNRTAVLTGVMTSNAEREIIKRQLRLEPGVYRIEDRTTNAR